MLKRMSFFIACSAVAFNGCDNRAQNRRIAELTEQVASLTAERAEARTALASMSNALEKASAELGEKVILLTSATKDLEKTKENLDEANSTCEQLRDQLEEQIAGFTSMSNQAARIISHLRERNRLMSSLKSQQSDMSDGSGNFKGCDVCGGKGRIKEVLECSHPSRYAYTGCGSTGWQNKAKHIVCKCCGGKGHHVHWRLCRRCGGTGNLNSK